MRLAPQSVPYRALQKAGGVVVFLVFVVNSGGFGLPLAVAAGAGVLLLALGYETAYYRRFEYALTEDTLDIRSGVVSRREREIPYRRIQNVDVSRSALQRAIGVAAVDLETAGGSSTEGSIRFVTPAEATRLQRAVQRRASDAAAGAEATAGSEASVGPDEEELFAISSTDLALVGALSFDGRLIGLLAFLSSGSFPLLSSVLPEPSAAALTATAIVGIAVLFFVSWVLGAAIAFSNYYGFRLARAGDELRYERGLIRRYSGSIPTEKVQALRITDNPAKRALGYASLSIETAGYAPGQGDDSGNESAVPIASVDRVYRLAREVESFGAPEFSRPPKRIRWRYAVRYAAAVGVLLGVAYGVDWYVAPDLPWYGVTALFAAVPPAAHLKWKHRGYWLGDDHLLTRNGFWGRSVAVVPYYRIQNVIDSRTVFQRRWGVATVVADTAGSGSNAVAVDFDADEAETIEAALTERLADAVAERRDRGVRGGFEWLHGEPGVDADPDSSVDASDRTSAADAGERKPPADTGESRNSTDADDLEVPDDGVVRPDFSTGDRDYSDPAERVDTGDYAVDRRASDADVPFGPREPDDRSGSGEPDDRPGSGEVDDRPGSGEPDDRPGSGGARDAAGDGTTDGIRDAEPRPTEDDRDDDAGEPSRSG